MRQRVGEVSRCWGAGWHASRTEASQLSRDNRPLDGLGYNSREQRWIKPVRSHAQGVLAFHTILSNMQGGGKSWQRTTIFISQASR